MTADQLRDLLGLLDDVTDAIDEGEIPDALTLLAIARDRVRGAIDWDDV